MYQLSHGHSCVFNAKQMTQLLYCNVSSTHSPHILDSLWQTVYPRKVRSWVSSAPTTRWLSLVCKLNFRGNANLGDFSCSENPTYMCHWSSALLADFDQIIFAFSRIVFASIASEISLHAARFALSDNKVRMSDVENEMDARFEV